MQLVSPVPWPPCRLREAGGRSKNLRESLAALAGACVHGILRKLLTSRAKYALRATLRLAELKPENGFTSAAELAEAADVPRKFLEAILTQLRDQGLVESRRGPAGGHRLIGEPSLVSAADVIRAIDGPLAMTPCASATAFRVCDDCAEVESCRLRHMMRRARDAVAGVLETCTLADLCA